MIVFDRHENVLGTDLTVNQCQLCAGNDVGCQKDLWRALWKRPRRYGDRSKASNISSVETPHATASSCQAASGFAPRRLQHCRPPFVQKGPRTVRSSSAHNGWALEIRAVLHGAALLSRSGQQSRTVERWTKQLAPVSVCQAGSPFLTPSALFYALHKHVSKRPRKRQTLLDRR